MANVTVQQPPPNLTFQGIVVPGSSLNPKAFFQGTRRQRVLTKQFGAWQGFGLTTVVDAIRAGILAGFWVTISGSLHVTPSTGSVASTARWPYGLLRSGRFQANGQSNLIQADGWFLRVREYMAHRGLTDRGVAQGIGGASPGTSRTQGTLSLDSESWGVGSNVTAIATGTYDVELSIYVPVAYEDKMLTGAVFCQTMSTTLELDLTWANLATLFTVVAPATVTFSPTVTIEADLFTIPSDGQGGMVLPNLSAFHSYVQSKAPNAIAAGQNEIYLAGQGVGRQLMRIIWRTQNGTPNVPLVPNATRVTNPYWKYGTNTIPETWVDGRKLRYDNERDYDTDIAPYAGFEAIDFDKTWAFRDSVNEGSATTLRFGYTLAGTLSSPSCEYAQDVILAGAAA
jgi:hypothetical protein